MSDHEKKVWKTSDSRRKSNKDKNRLRKIRNQQYLWDYLKKNHCVDCGESDPIVLTFDHMNEGEKNFNLSEAGARSYSINKIKEEIKKCQVRCCNCHARRTAKQFGWYKEIIK